MKVFALLRIAPMKDNPGVVRLPVDNESDLIWIFDMAKARPTKDSYNVSYTLRDDVTNDEIIVVNMNWENRSVEEVKNNINTWLRASGLDLEVVDKK
jgi:hypothetical protein